ncbi:DUF4397 domain-containing protein [Orlajensenia leifsoniae]|uniref:DUF4397 domain-containing protein n=1 Tax=Orlajensenia leifsoniae TaxID=2561933 RepID=A0A4Y9R259_9MICO|nr:DUF4397 domain-containing protein [Leifsonia flava]TFV98781.1 DUF4397 domain-containing protein [Leifsonia flava]
MPHHGSRTRRALRTVTAAAIVAIGFAFTPSAATAADAGTGWLRLGHLSPDTKSVDVEVTAPNGDTVLELNGVSYGDVSPYSELQSGTYTVSMVPEGSSAATAPVISADIEVPAKSAMTVVAYGPTSDLEVKAVEDDLAPPTAGFGRIRLFQASTITDSVDVETSTGLPIAKDAAAGTVTDYAEIPAGSWTLELTGGDAAASSDVDVAAGSVSTLFVLDTADGGLTILPIVDSAAVGRSPDGGVQTGGGGTAPGGSLFTAGRMHGGLEAVR